MGQEEGDGARRVDLEEKGLVEVEVEAEMLNVMFGNGGSLEDYEIERRKLTQLKVCTDTVLLQRRMTKR